MEHHNLIDQNSIEVFTSVTPKPMFGIIAGSLLCFYSLLQIPAHESITHAILEATQIIASIVGIVISLVTFYFLVLKPKLLDKKTKRKKS